MSCYEYILFSYQGGDVDSNNSTDPGPTLYILFSYQGVDVDSNNSTDPGPYSIYFV